MKTISTTDLKLIPELSHFTMVDFIDPKNDAVLAPFLKVLGFDLDYPIEFLARQHRNLQGKVVIGFMLAGEVDINSSFLSSSLATPEDRIIAAGYKDISLAHEMSRSLSTSREYNSGVTEGFPAELTNPDERAIIEQLEVLENLLHQMRPDMYREDGCLKTITEYHAPTVQVVKKERRKRLVKVDK